MGSVYVVGFFYGGQFLDFQTPLACTVAIDCAKQTIKRIRYVAFPDESKINCNQFPYAQTGRHWETFILMLLSILTWQLYYLQYRSRHSSFTHTSTCLIWLQCSWKGFSTPRDAWNILHVQNSIQRHRWWQSSKLSWFFIVLIIPEKAYSCPESCVCSEPNSRVVWWYSDTFEHVWPRGEFIPVLYEVNDNGTY